MDLDLIDLAGFTELEQQVILNSETKYITRTTFDHRLLIVTEVNRQTQQVKLRSNFEWEQLGTKWRPNVSKPNAKFVDPLI